MQRGCNKGVHWREGVLKGFTGGGSIIVVYWTEIVLKRFIGGTALSGALERGYINGVHWRKGVKEGFIEEMVY